MFARNGHYVTDTGTTYCHDTAEFDVREDGETVVVGPQPTDYCRACRTAEPDWEELTEHEFNQSYN